MSIPGGTGYHPMHQAARCKVAAPSPPMGRSSRKRASLGRRFRLLGDILRSYQGRLNVRGSKPVGGWLLRGASALQCRPDATGFRIKGVKFRVEAPQGSLRSNTAPQCRSDAPGFRGSSIEFRFSTPKGGLRSNASLRCRPGAPAGCRVES